MESRAQFRFSFGPWNIHEGADVFGPPVRKPVPFAEKLAVYKRLGFDGVQFHDDDVVASVDVPHEQLVKEAQAVRKLLDNEGLVAEFVAPRLWEHPLTIDGGYTANDPQARAYARERSKKAIDIANILGTKLIVLWPAREGIYVNESKDHRRNIERLVEAINEMLDYDKEIKILGEMKPNEPMDHAYVPTTGHFLAVSYTTNDPDRVGTLIESAHAILAGLDPAIEMGFALYHDKLWSVHLNDQNGLKFDEDRIFGAINLKRAFDQVLVLYENDYGANGEFVGLDVKALRTQKAEVATQHLAHSRQIFLDLLEVVKGLDRTSLEAYRTSRNYEELEYFIIKHLMGTS
ncbi:TIM barrel protein [candidate division KSB3 bacterium]|uniref:Xylose isomerase n=1 Tax=candidate division KSB3 bacterium TaxID=2044937 RepID=A0A9D5JV75_9BACT|nr:TIM barrel protein [candidate division KSB3 bacterium]MBD3324770.1 TIM barrel protein [candidate division KSB3 bacterium]